MAEPMNATRWGVRAVDSDFVRVYINGLLFDFDPRGAADLAQTIRVILGSEKPAPVAPEATTERTDLIAAYAVHLRSAGDRADAAEAVIARSRAALAAFDGRGVNNVDVPTPREVLDAWTASLAAPESPGAKQEGCDDPDCSRTECLHLGTCREDAMDPPETTPAAPAETQAPGPAVRRELPGLTSGPHRGGSGLTSEATPTPDAPTGGED